jgi:hypothetical protein
MIDHIEYGVRGIGLSARHRCVRAMPRPDHVGVLVSWPDLIRG